MLGLSLTHDQVPGLPFPMHPDDDESSHAVSTQCAYPASRQWRGVNPQVEQAEIENHNRLPPQEIDGVSGQAEGSTLVATQGQSATPPGQTKKEKDMMRKRAQRLDDAQHFELICKLLEISPNPKNNLVRRSE